MYIDNLKSRKTERYNGIFCQNNCNMIKKYFEHVKGLAEF